MVKVVQRVFGFCLGLSIAASSTACLTFSGDQPARLESSPGPAVKPLRTEVAVGDFTLRVRGGQMKTSYRQGLTTNRRIMDYWVDRGWISGYSNAPRSAFSQDAELCITLSGRELGSNPIGLQIISALTLFVIPSVWKGNLALTYTAENRKTGASGSATIEGYYREVHELLFLPVTPFATVGRTKTYEAMSENLYAQLEAQGVMAPAN